MAFPNFELGLFNARVFARPAPRPKVIGHIRRGAVVPAKAPVRGRGCPGGRWHPVRGGGVVCTSIGFEVGRRAPRFRGPAQRQPAQSADVPFRYAKVTRRGAPLLRHRPTFKEVLQLEEAAAGRVPWPDVVQRRMNGIFILAIDRKVQVGDRTFYRTVQGQYVEAEGLEWKSPPRMRGEVLRGARSLPLAFVHADGASGYCRRGAALKRCARLAKHARLAVRHLRTINRQRYVEGRDGRLLLRQDVRLARRRPPPPEIPAGGKWVHLDLSEQTLVAYEGRRPVFATLISSGKKGYRTRPGLFRIVNKYVTTTMDATDPIDGFYRIEEVPWTMYYWRSFAVHGAFWHDDFGVPRSHGCTNVSPADARWLFRWTTPAVPRGWHARLNAHGTWFYFTD